MWFRFVFCATLLAATVVTVGEADTAVNAGSSGGAQVPELRVGSDVSGAAAASAAPNVDVVLYDQYDNQVSSSPLNVSSQNFEDDSLDDEAADDFVIPAGQGWRITEVDVDGEYFDTGGAAGTTVAVLFHKNANGDLPGTGLGGANNSFSMGPAAGDFVIPLSFAIPLGPGKYWVSVQANQNSNPGRYWGWHDRSVLSNSGSAWMNSGNGWGTGCTDWIRKTSCVGLGNPHPDQVFRLSGTLFTLLPENFEAGSLGAFWSEGNPGWSNVSNSSHSPTHSAFAPDVNVVSDQRLILGAPLSIPDSATVANLTFWHRYAFEASGFDGGVLEGSWNHGVNWFDLGPNITSGGYNGTIAGSGNPLSGRMGWVNNPNGAAFVPVTVNLLPYKGDPSILLRFRQGTNSSNGATGWWIDDVALTLGAPTAVRLTSFTAHSRPDAVELRWRTAAGTRLLGFNVWRSPGGSKPWLKLNKSLIADTGAHSYRYLDRSAHAAASYTYRLETVDLDGHVTQSHPITVSPAFSDAGGGTGGWVPRFGPSLRR